MNVTLKATKCPTIDMTRKDISLIDHSGSV